MALLKIRPYTAFVGPQFCRLPSLHLGYQSIRFIGGNLARYLVGKDFQPAHIPIDFFLRHRRLTLRGELPVLVDHWRVSPDSPDVFHQVGQLGKKPAPLLCLPQCSGKLRGRNIFLTQQIKPVISQYADRFAVVPRLRVVREQLHQPSVHIRFRQKHLSPPKVRQLRACTAGSQYV